HSAPSLIQRCSSATWSGSSPCGCSSGGGIFSSGSSLRIRRTISEADGSPGTTTRLPDSPSPSACSRKMNDTPPACFTPPWQVVQFFVRIGRMSRLKSTGSAAAETVRKTTADGKRRISEDKIRGDGGNPSPERTVHSPRPRETRPHPDGCGSLRGPGNPGVEQIPGFGPQAFGRKTVDPRTVVAGQLRAAFLKEDPKIKLAVPDALHIATALVVGADDFHTFDDGKMDS